VAAPLIWLLVSSAVAYRLTHRRSPRFAEQAPAITWGRIDSDRIKTSDGEELGAWFVDGRDHAPGVLLLHGSNGNRGHMLRRAQFLASHGFAALLITFRAHGDSTGNYHDIGWGARQDVWAAVDYMEKRRPGCPIIVSGNSMGSAAAIFAASELGHRVGGYILESPYQDLKVAVWNRTDNALPPLLSHVAYAGLRTVAPVFLPHLDRISPLAAVSGIPGDVPVLILAGDADRLARVHEVRAIHHAVESHGKLVLFPGAGHGNLFNSDRDRYERTVLEFCRGIEKNENRLSEKAGD
jgi:alpha-beta hydrolase superfamily lysophospholipase